MEVKTVVEPCVSQVNEVVGTEGHFLFSYDVDKNEIFD